jgi:hypothetical protein
LIQTPDTTQRRGNKLEEAIYLLAVVFFGSTPLLSSAITAASLPSLFSFFLYMGRQQTGMGIFEHFLSTNQHVHCKERESSVRDIPAVDGKIANFFTVYLHFYRTEDPSVNLTVLYLFRE